MKKQKLFYGWIVAICCTLLAFSVNAMGNNALSFYIAPVSKSLGVTRATLNFAMFTMGMLTRTLFGLVYGKLAKRFGVKRLMIVALGLVLTGYFLYSRANGLVMIGIGSALYGVAHAIGTFSAYNVIVNNWFIGQKGLVLGMINTAVGLGGTLINPLVSNWIAVYGWNASFLYTGALIAAIAIPSLILVRETPAEMGLSPRQGGTDQSKSKPSVPDGNVLSVNDALKDARFWMIIATQFLIGFGVGPCFSNVIASLTSSGVDPMLITSALSIVLAVGVTIGNITGGVIYDRFGLRTLIGTGCGVVGLGILMMGFVGADTPAWLLIPSVVCVGFGNMLSLGTVSHMINTIFGFGKTDFSSLFGIVFAIHNLGSMVGSPIFGLIYDKTGSYHLGYRSALVILALIFILVNQAIRLSRKTKTA